VKNPAPALGLVTALIQHSFKSLSKPNFDKIARSTAMSLLLRSRDMEGCQNFKSTSRDLFSTPLT